jgi:hypothetical protein
MDKKLLNIIISILSVIFISLNTTGQTPSVYEIKLMPFSSETFSDISPVIFKDGIMFCSDRRFSGVRDRTSFDGRRLYGIYLAERKDTAKWDKPKELKSERNSLFNSGPLCFSADGKTVYFTSEVETGKAVKNKNFRNHSGIFIAELSGTDLVSLKPFQYNNSEYEVAHPSISKDGKYLFFASDMPGGSGGSDLYFCELVNGAWSSPVNLGPKVNTSSSEYYPYMHSSGKLYFASGRPGGLGGLDVYFTFLNSGTWESPVLLPEPINSGSDDFALVAGDNLQTGYFSSNRNRNDDIYHFSSTMIRKASCDSIAENSYCFRFQEENAVKFDTLPFRYEWKFGDGNKAAGVVVEHCYEGPGTYIVQLDVVNLITKQVIYNEKSDTLILTDVEQAYITSPDNTSPGQRIDLSAEDTNLPGWRISQYYWNFGDETIAIGSKVSKIYSRPGTYNVQLIVSTEPEPGGMTRETCISKNIMVESNP